MFTAARSAYLLAFLSLVTLAVLTRDRRFRVAVASTTLLLMAVFAAQSDVRETMIAFFQPERSTGLENSLANRTADYEPLARRVDDAPLFGYGPRTSRPTSWSGATASRIRANLVLDNAYLGHLVETGILGLGALLLLLFTGYAGAWRAVPRP